MGEFDLSLIIEFRNRPCLYDRNSSRFKDKLYTAQQWQEISNKLGYDVSILKDRMLQLRNRYNLEKRRIEQLHEENPQKYISSPWPMYDNLQFLSDHIKARRRYKHLPLNSHSKMDHSAFLHDSNDYSALGTDADALEAAQDDASRYMMEGSGGPHTPFPNALLSVKVEENLSGDQASDAETETSHQIGSESNIFGDSSHLMSEIHSPKNNRQKILLLDSNKSRNSPQLQQQQFQQQHEHLEQQRHLQQQQFHQHQQQEEMPIQQRQKISLRPQLQLKSQYTQRHHSTPTNGSAPSRSSINGNDYENHLPHLPPLQRLVPVPAPKKRVLEKSYRDNDSMRSEAKRAAIMAGSLRKAMLQPPPRRRLSPRELKYNAFGNFVSSSLMDLPQKMALELLEKFTSDIVKALTMKMDNMEETNSDKSAVETHMQE